MESGLLVPMSYTFVGCSSCFERSFQPLRTLLVGTDGSLAPTGVIGTFWEKKNSPV